MSNVTILPMSLNKYSGDGSDLLGLSKTIMGVTVDRHNDEYILLYSINSLRWEKGENFRTLRRYFSAEQLLKYLIMDRDQWYLLKPHIPIPAREIELRVAKKKVNKYSTRSIVDPVHGPISKCKCCEIYKPIRYFPINGGYVAYNCKSCRESIQKLQEKAKRELKSFRAASKRNDNKAFLDIPQNRKD